MASEFKIEKGVPVPSPKAGCKPKYPWADMDVGDSFLANSSISQSGMSATTRNVERRRGWKFTVRKTRDGIRVWRIA